MLLIHEFETPLGTLSVAECKGRALAVHFGSFAELLEEFEYLRESCALPKRVRSLPDGAVVARALADYLAGDSPQLKVKVDLTLVKSEFDRQVLKALYKTRAGRRLSYAELAEKTGLRRAAARAVGSAMRRNPLPIVIPCHRVVRSDGELGHYTGGIDKKEWLLAHEA